MTDLELLRHFVTERSASAFAQIVERRIDMVYAAALRQLAGDTHRAEDVTQEVFATLAEKALTLANHPDLTGWLYTSTYYSAIKVIRSEQRRRRRESDAHFMNEADEEMPAPSINWERVRAVLDAAMHDLNERDRSIVLQHFFERSSFAKIADSLGISQNAAQKAAQRAVDQLHAALARRGISSTSAALAAGLASNTIAAAPASLIPVVTRVAMAGVEAPAGGIGLLTLMKATNLALIGLGVLATVTTSLLLRERSLNNATKETLETERQALRTQIVSLGAKLASAESNAKAADDDNANLLKAITDLNFAMTAALPAPKSRDRSFLTRDVAFAEVLATVMQLEAKARAKPGYKPYQEPDQAPLSAEQRRNLAQLRKTAEDKKQHVFVVFDKPGGTIVIPPFPNERIRAIYPQLTEEDWARLDSRYARASAESEIADWGTRPTKR